jgi:hypothetical protein
MVDPGPPTNAMIAGVIIVITLVAGTILFPLIRAWARRLEGRTVDQGLLNEVDQLRTRVAELEEAQHRMVELEERLDFAERLLVQRSEPAQLPRGEERRGA